MDVQLGIFGSIHLNHPIDVREIQPPGSQIGREEHRVGTLRVEHPLSSNGTPSNHPFWSLRVRTTDSEIVLSNETILVKLARSTGYLTALHRLQTSPDSSKSEQQRSPAESNVLALPLVPTFWRSVMNNRKFTGISVTKIVNMCLK
mmetsp:Transcript_21940/g.25179  ORF Transcript_21940/g.25179 Transcript_21940/m.25179 type:complete len:146 (+) Transcript_21940:482-919(+)